MPTINVDISPEGDIKIDAIGFTGKACEEATRALEQALGVQSGPRQMKPEAQQVQRRTVGAGGGR